jgi:hypothetical protein
MGDPALKEIEVLVDVRLSPDSADLILTRQTLAIAGGELKAVNDPVESRLSLLVRRARVSLGASADNMMGFVANASVQNTGLIPLEITKVCLDYRYDEPRQVTVQNIEANEIGGELNFVPKDRKRVGPLSPLETRSYFLPTEFMDGVSEMLQTLPITNFKVIAYSDKDAVGEAPGIHLQSFLYLLRPSKFGMVRYGSHVARLLENLDLRSSDNIRSALNSLAHTPVDQWHGYSGLNQVNEGFYFLSVPPDFQILLRQLKPGGIEVRDLIRARGPKAARSAEDSVGAQK